MGNLKYLRARYSSSTDVQTESNIRGVIEGLVCTRRETHDSVP